MRPLPPAPGPAAGRAALRALARGRSLLPALSALHAELGDIFRLPVPGFNAVVLAGPEAARFVLVSGRDDLRWRMEADPVTRLLRHGLLVEDGDAHERLRQIMTPALHRRLMEAQIGAMNDCASEMQAGWPDSGVIEAAPEMRRLALRVLTRCVFGADIAPALDGVWRAILRTLEFIGPGLWVVWPGVPRPGYRRARVRLDAYLADLIAMGRARPRGLDLLSLLIEAGLSDDLIRDQLLTMLIAGHDTATAMLAWAVYALGRHPGVLRAARAEVDAVLGGEKPNAENTRRMPYLECVIKETLRLYPPIHAGNRLAARDLEFGGYRIPAGTRLLFSIFLTHRQPDYWPEPERFDPARFALDAGRPPAPMSYVPFGGGPRFCIGTALAQVEARVVLARVLQAFEFELRPGAVYLRMGATLEPSTHLPMRVRRRAEATGGQRRRGLKPPG